MGRLSSKVVLITGAANGIGAATAKMCSREGAEAVIVADVLDDSGQAVVDEIAVGGGRAEFAHLDVTEDAQWEATFNAVVDRYGRIDVVVNNAGVSGSAAVDLFDTDVWNRLMAVNATGVFLGMKYAVSQMLAQGTGGSIVNISSIAGIVGNSGIHFAYNASKGAVRSMTKGVAVTYAGDNVRVNSIHPGIMPAMVTSGRTALPERRAQLLGRIPMGRSGEVDEVAAAIVYLASDEASYVTGSELVIDGGYTAQ